MIQVGGTFHTGGATLLETPFGFMREIARDQVLLRKEPSRGLDERLQPIVRTESDERDKPEPPWRVVLHNDDVTPIEYVADLLRRVFQLGRARAAWIAVKAHTMGTAVVAVEPRDEAEAHVQSAHELARSDGHLHLTFSAEPVED